MTTNSGVKALLEWVNHINLSDQDVNITDLQDGTILQKLVCMLKKEPIFCLNDSTDDRYLLVANFIERDCRFSTASGTSISWNDIRDGINLSVEIAKVLLLLLYYDMMNDRCTLKTLDCNVEKELAHLTGSFLMENEDCVYLSNGLDAYLTKKYIPFSRDVFEQTETSSSSSVSTVSSLWEDSPVFHRSQRVNFLETETVASSSNSKSPLEDIMNTPKFQLRKMKRQIMMERDYRDGLERELANKLALIAQRESHINQLQYRLDKMKELQGDEEQMIRQQINELETKNDTLQMRLNEILKENKDLKNTTSLMEHKVDELTDENGSLSSQVRAVSSQLGAFEAEVARLRETQASAQEEWHKQTSHLQSALNQATAQKELLAEQIQILQGKISCLEDQMSKAAQEETGENMGPVMERASLESEISCLKHELEGTRLSLKKAEVEIQDKSQQLLEKKQEIAEHKDLLNNEKSHTREIIQAKDEIYNKLQKELTEEQAVLQQEIRRLKFELEQVERQKSEEIARLQQHICDCNQEIEQLKGVVKRGEEQLMSSQDEVKRLNAEIHAKEEQLNQLKTETSTHSELLQQELEGLNEQIKSMSSSLEMAKEEVEAKENLIAKQEQESTLRVEELQQHSALLEEEVTRLKQEIQNKQGEVDALQLESVRKSEVLQEEIQLLKDQVEQLNASLKTATEQINANDNLLAEKEMEMTQEKDTFQNMMKSSEEEISGLKEQIEDKEQQLVTLQKDSAIHSDKLQHDIQDLQAQLDRLQVSLTQAEKNNQIQLDILNKQEQESASQIENLQQQLCTSNDKVKCMQEELQTKEEQINVLKDQSSVQVQQLCEQIQNFEQNVDCLSSSLKTAEEKLKSKESLLVDQQLKNNLHVEELQKQVLSSQDDVKRLNAEIHAKEEQLNQLKTETSTDSELLQQELEGLNEQIKSMSSSLEMAKEEVEAKENLIAKIEQESTLRVEELQQHSALLEEEVTRLKQEIQNKQGEVDALQLESVRKSEVLQEEIQLLKDQVEQLNASLKTATEQIKAKDNLLAEKEMEITQEKDSFQNMMKSSEEEISGLKEQIEDKEQQLVTLQKDSNVQEQEIKALRTQLDHMCASLKKAEEDVQNNLERLNNQEQESAHHSEHLQQQLSASEEEVKNMKAVVQAKEEQIVVQKTKMLEQCDLLNQEIQRLKKEVETLVCSLRAAHSDVQSKEVLLSQEQQKNSEQEEVLQRLHVQLQQVDTLQIEISARDQDVNLLREQVAAQERLLQKAKEDAEANTKILIITKEESSKQIDVLQNETQNLKQKLENVSQHQLVEVQEFEQKINLLQEQLVTVNAELKKHKDTQAENLRLKEAKRDLKAAALLEKDALVQEKEALAVRLQHTERNCDVLEKRLETILSDNNRLAHANQAMEKEIKASQNSMSVLQQQLEKFKMEKEKLLEKNAERSQHNNRELQEQLAAKTEAANHYKTQMENAVNHYNGKKQLLQKSQEEVEQLRTSLEVKESELKAFAMEKQLLTHELDEAETNNKRLLNKVASLEAQLAFADRALRAKNKIHATGDAATEICNSELPIKNVGVYTAALEKRSMSSDSLDQSSLEFDPNTKRLSAPEEASTPLVRSSERLAAKRKTQRTESLETLYFTPINTRKTNRASAEQDSELDSVRRNPTSSVKRRRTTQVINITLTKKTPGGSDDDESFHSLAPARSQPNLPTAHSSQFMSKELFVTPAKKTNAASDQLVGFPGYRRSAVHCQSASTFCAMGEGEDDGAPDDWVRIAELQARNKACLPHLKSSYPVECEPCRNSALVFTDEELRTGDPSETIRRASMMPGQLQDSLVSHRQSLMLGQAGVSAGTRSHRLSLMPGQLPTKDRKFTSSTLSVPQASPEKKMRASCFPRPLTPKNKNVSSGRSNSHLHTAVSPVDKKPATMFVIDNTPKQKGYLQKRLDKIRGSTRKSPGQRPKVSSAQTSTQKSQENKPAGNLRAGGARTGRGDGLKSPQVATRGLRKSPQTSSRSAKSPGLTASARKMMRRMKV